MGRSPQIDEDDIPLFDRIQRQRTSRPDRLFDDPGEIERAAYAREAEAYGRNYGSRRR